MNSFEVKKLNCTFNDEYFNLNETECYLKVEGGRNKYAGGRSELIKSLDDIVVSIPMQIVNVHVDFFVSVLLFWH